MSYLKIDSELVEQSKDMIRYALNYVEEAEAVLRQTLNEMVEESAQFYGIPIWQVVCATTETAFNKIKLLAERMSSFSMLMQGVPQEYVEMEQAHIRTLDKVSARVTTVNALLTGSMTNSYPAGLAEGENQSKAKALEQSLANSVVSMEMANLMAVSKVIEEEYTCEKVLPIGQMTYIDHQKKEDEE